MNAPAPARTLVEKLWQRHAVCEREDGQTLLYIDRHLIHEGSIRGFMLLAQRRLPLRRPDRTVGMADHFVSSHASRPADMEPRRRALLTTFERNMRDHGVMGFSVSDERQGIVHVVGPEQGLTLPGMTVVCGDSHTSTHGALGALAFGIGASEVSHVLATQTLWQKRPKTLRVGVEGQLGPGVTAKDLVLYLIAQIGAAGANGYVIEYHGRAVRSLSMEGRLTVCNMSIEAGARAGLVAPDDTTFEYLSGRPYAPSGEKWDAAVRDWRELVSDADAVFDRELRFDAALIAPMITWGTSPQDAAPVDARVPDPAQTADSTRRKAVRDALDYMDLLPGTPFEKIRVDRVFIGSCTNSRIEDLRMAAKVVAGRKVSPGVRAMVVPGSVPVKRAAEAEQLDRVFRDAGFEWREPGCSMCVGMNGDTAQQGERVASTSNRNFVGRQGPGARTHLMSPAMAAAAAVTGHLTDVRRLLQAS